MLVSIALGALLTKVLSDYFSTSQAFSYILAGSAVLPVSIALWGVKELNSLSSDSQKHIRNREASRLKDIINIRYRQLVLLGASLIFMQFLFILIYQFSNGCLKNYSIFILSGLTLSCVPYLIHMISISKEISDFRTEIERRTLNKSKIKEYLENKEA